MAKLSGPLLDRIDLHVHVPPVEVSALRSIGAGDSSAVVRERVIRARGMQEARVRGGETTVSVNACLAPRDLDRVATPDEAGSRILMSAVEKLGLSARAFTKVLRVARTIADLEGCDGVRATHVAEAIHGRVLDRATTAVS